MLIALRWQAGLLLAVLAGWTAAAPNLEAYGRLPSIEMMALSRDGKKLAFVHSVGEQHLLSVVDPDEAKLLGGLRLSDAKVRGLDWADDRHILITTASTQMPMELYGEKTEWHLMLDYDVETKKTHGVLEHVRAEKRVMNVVAGEPIIPRHDKDPVMFLHGIYIDGRTEIGLFKVNLQTGAETMVKEGGEATRFWLINDAGEIVAEQDYHDEQRRWAIRLMKNGRAQQTVSGTAALDYPHILGLSPDGSSAIVAVHDDDQVHWRQLALRDGSWGDDIAPDKEVTEILFDAGSSQMIGTAYVADQTHYYFVDPAVQRRWDWVERLYWKQRVEFIAISSDHTKFLVEVLGPKIGYAYVLVDADEHLARQVGKVYADVEQIAEVRPITYKAADGLEIPAYLTLPPGRPEKALPVIVMPHGGPQARDVFGFDWWAQALASEGYAVLQPNYRGSNLSTPWVEKGYGEWGRKMQSDVSDGLRYLAAAGIVDAQRACIVGASYGGYAALAGVTLESGTYRCAVAVAGVSDPAGMLRQVRRETGSRDSETQRYWQRFMGADGPTDKRLDEISPLKHADRATAPVLLIHGKEDSIVPYDQSEDMYKALNKLGKPVEFVTLNKEDHHLSRSETRLQMLTTSVAFLRKYNPPE